MDETSKNTELMKLDPHIEKLLHERYYLKNETSWEQVARRVSVVDPKMYDRILNRVFIPSSPTLMNLNTNGERHGTLSSCFILDVNDSIEDIMNAMKDTAFVTKAAGGVGFNWSKVRGSNENVKSINANSGGVMAFIQIFDSVLDGVRQGGRRRGAGMSLLSVYHPNILQFIDAKADDTKKFTRSNFSVKIDSEFYDILKKAPNTPFCTRNVVDKKKVPLVNEAGVAFTYQMLWDKIIHNAWKSAEPGIFNGDIAADRCTCKNITRDINSNPCCSSDTLVYVADGRGAVPMGVLAQEAKDVPVFTVNHNGVICVKEMVNPHLTRRNAKIYKVVFDNGVFVRVTENHQFITDQGRRVKAVNLQVGDKIKSVHELGSNINVDQSSFIGGEYKPGSSITKKCETCGESFSVGYSDRHVTYCSKACLDEGLSKQYRFKDTSSTGLLFNQKVVSVTPDGVEDVYDGTVEWSHTILIAGNPVSDNNGKKVYEYILTSNCSEYTGIPYSACNLASPNVSKLLKDNKFDWKAFGELITESVIYMNGIIDANDYPLPKIQSETLAIRPIGLGIMGVAHLLYLLEIPYDSQEAYDFVAKLLRFETLTAMRKSVDIAKEKGVTYRYYDYATFMDANKRFFTEDSFMGIDVKQLAADIKKYGSYNSCFTSVAPTGSLSFIADCSGGIEPVFGLVFTRKIEKENKTYEKVYLVDPIFKDYINRKYPTLSNKIYDYVSEHNGSCVGCPQLTPKEQSFFKVAGDITPEWHLKILAAVANNVSLSCSKTINVPKNCKESDISKVFLDAYQLGIIGVTVYRDGSREGVLIHNEDSNVLPDHVGRHHAPKRPADLPCDIHEMLVSVNGKKERYVALVGKLAGTVYEIFVTKDSKNELNFEKHKHGILRKVRKGKYDLIIGSGTEKVCLEDVNERFGGWMGTLSRLVSMSLRHGTPLSIVVEQLSKGTNAGFLDFEKCVARVLKHYITEGEAVITSEVCPTCGKKLIYIEGCKTCSDRQCGWSKCG